MSTETDNYFESRRGATMLWTGVLAGPVLWFLNQQINLVLVPFLCPAQIVWPLHVVSLACLAGALATARLAWRNWARLRHEAPDQETPRSRSHFMAAVGLMSSALFVLVILAQAIPNFILDPCHR